MNDQYLDSVHVPPALVLNTAVRPVRDWRVAGLLVGVFDVLFFRVIVCVGYRTPVPHTTLHGIAVFPVKHGVPLMLHLFVSGEHT